MSKYYIYEYSPDTFALFKVIHDDKNFTYGKYLFPKHLTNKTSSFFPKGHDQYYEITNPNHMMRLCYRLVKEDITYKTTPLSFSVDLYKASFRSKLYYLLKTFCKYPIILSKLNQNKFKLLYYFLLIRREWKLKC